AWGYEQRGENRFGRYGAYIPLELVDYLAATDPDALALLNVLKANNGPASEFMIVNAMAGSRINLGWRRFSKARAVLKAEGIVDQVRPDCQGRPALYRWGKGS